MFDASYRPTAPARTLLAMSLLVALACFADAQPSLGNDVAEGICGARLGEAFAALDDRARGDPARVATALTRVAFDALEPAYPVTGSDEGVGDPDAAWLARRGWLPGSWHETSWNADAWRALLTRMQRPYGLEPLPVTGASDSITLARETQAALAAAAQAVRPLAMIGVDRSIEGSDVVVFANVIWNWTPHARLLTFDLADRDVEPGTDPPDLLGDMGSCAWTPRDWIFAPAASAREFYTGNVDAEMQILASDAREFGSAVSVAAGDEEAALRLEHPTLAGASVAALGFRGPGPSLGTVLRLALSIRTNVGLFDISRYLEFPPR